MKTAGVVITYNRKELLAKNLEMIFCQTVLPDAVYVIDNHSSDGTEEHLRNLGYLDNSRMRYIYMNENTGAAGGFEYGVQVAYEAGYDWFWLMDDDGRPADSLALERLLDFANDQIQSNPYVMVNSLVTCAEGRMTFLTFGTFDEEEVKRRAVDGIIWNEIDPFNGTLVSRELIGKLGYPIGAFFVKENEFDYKVRAKNVGAVIATVVDSVHFHPQANQNYRKILGFTFRYKIEDPWKEYYRVRNKTYIFRREGQHLKVAKLLLSRFRAILLADCKKRETMKMLRRGFSDGRAGRLGITIRP
ncbi:MAG: glycosyltransferase [Clostridiales bacterium]|nr:glycosyltransferase [Clostridiales bacterium]